MKTAEQILAERQFRPVYEHKHEFVPGLNGEACANCHQTREVIAENERFNATMLELQRIAYDEHETPERRRKALHAFERAVWVVGSANPIARQQGRQTRSHGAGSALHESIETGSSDI